MVAVDDPFRLAIKCGAIRAEFFRWSLNPTGPPEKAIKMMHRQSGRLSEFAAEGRFTRAATSEHCNTLHPVLSLFEGFATSNPDDGIQLTWLLIRDLDPYRVKVVLQMKSNVP